jgi:hypothetical protein
MSNKQLEDGKKRTYAQWQKKIKAENEKNEDVPPEETGERPGVCVCGCGTFTHKMVNRELVRVCKNEECKAELVI